MTDQLTRDDLAAMTPAEIDAAMTDGRCDALLGMDEAEARVRALARGTEPLTREDVAAMRGYGLNDEISAAYAAGRIQTNNTNQE